MRPHLFLDIDGVLQAPSMKYGYERTAVIRERIPMAEVHPRMRPRKFSGEAPDWLARRRGTPTHVAFNTPVRTSPKLSEDIAVLDVDVLMLTTWLEHDSVDAFFVQSAGPAFPYSKLRFPGRDHADPLGALPERWKVDEVIRTLDADPRPFIWADDDEVPMWREEMADRYPDLPMLLIAPESNLGITSAHMDEMREFAATHGPA